MQLTHSAISRLRSQHESIPFILNGMQEPLLRYRPNPQKWSILEHVAHLARYQELMPERIRRLLLEETPAFDRYSAEEDPHFKKWCALDWWVLWSGLVAGRQALAKLLTDLHPSDLDRTAIHPLYGAIPIPFWVEFFLIHEAHHLYTILQLVGVIRKEQLENVQRINK
ncbi:MAG: DinB family protein [Rhodothermia bacterium]|nr:DinB family protein [Rhodothermia bacterium]